MAAKKQKTKKHVEINPMMHYTVFIALIISMITTFLLGIVLTETLVNSGYRYFDEIAEHGKAAQKAQAFGERQYVEERREVPRPGERKGGGPDPIGHVLKLRGNLALSSNVEWRCRTAPVEIEVIIPTNLEGSVGAYVAYYTFPHSVKFTVDCWTGEDIVIYPKDNSHTNVSISLDESQPWASDQLNIDSYQDLLPTIDLAAKTIALPNVDGLNFSSLDFDSQGDLRDVGLESGNSWFRVEEQGVVNYRGNLTIVDFRNYNSR